jgi:thymidylate kinase
MFFTAILFMVLIGVEGGMGSGKSTLIQKLGREHGYKHFPEAITYLDGDETNKLWKAAGTDDALDILFEAEGRRFDNIKKECQTERGKVLLDRTCLTFAGYEYAKQQPLRVEKVFGYMRSNGHSLPRLDCILFLDVNISERNRRVFQERGDSVSRDDSLVSNDFNVRLRQFFEEQNEVKTHFIETASKTKQQVYEEALEIVKKY